MSVDPPFLQFQANSRAFAARSRDHLAAFQSSADVPRFFYAALELRFGIEARVIDYLRSALKTLGRDSKDIDDYVASKLLRRLAEIEPKYEDAATVRITSERTGRSSFLHYTPVTRELAAVHGRLGELLHCKFFLNNEHWFYKKPLGGSPHRSIADFVPLIENGIAELERANTGTLLGHPRFTEIVQDVLSQEPPSGKQDDG